MKSALSFVVILSLVCSVKVAADDEPLRPVSGFGYVFVAPGAIQCLDATKCDAVGFRGFPGTTHERSLALGGGGELMIGGGPVGLGIEGGWLRGFEPSARHVPSSV